MNTRDLDDKIREALQGEDEAAWESGGEQSIFGLVTETMRGRMWWLNLWAYVFSLVFFGLSIYAGWQLLTTEDPLLAVRWAVGFLFCSMAVAMMKMWFWMQMDRHALTREIKRLELQVARLTSRVGR